MVRSSIAAAAAVAAALAALAIGPPAPALATPSPDRPAVHSSGMSAEFPVGRCIEIPSSMPTDLAVAISDPRYVTSVPCTDPNRNYRVVAHVPEESQCGPETSRVYYTHDVGVLCTVRA